MGVRRSGARRAFAAGVGAFALVGGALVGAAPAQAVGSYQNVGLGINWSSGDLGMTAAFLADPSGSLNDCSGDLTQSGCNFSFVSQIDDAADSASGAPTTGDNPGGDFLPLVGGFGNGAFGQVFTATATGELTSFTMQLTCVDQTGEGITGIEAAIYETDETGVTISGDALAGGPVDLSACPTDTTAGSIGEWAPESFAAITLPVSGAALMAGHHYAVLFGGSFVGGIQPPGLSSTPNAPTDLVVTPGSGRLSVAFTAPTDDGGSAITGYGWTSDDGATWHDAGTTTSPVSITGLTNGTPYTVAIKAYNANGDGAVSDAATGTPVASTPSVTRPTLATWSTVAGHQTTLRLLRTSGSPKATLRSLTPAMCSVSGSLVVFHVKGTCRVQVMQGGKVWKTLTTTVSATSGPRGAANTDNVRSIAFAPDSSTVSPAAAATLRALAPRLRAAQVVVVHGFAAGDIPSGHNAYTWRLTEARAQSVARYLRSLGVHVLLAHGYNTWLPLDPAHPFSSVNRRADVAWI